MTDVDEFPPVEDFRNRQADIQRAKEEMAGPMPLIPGAVDNVLTLPRGLYLDGVWKTRVTVQELTGADEEALAKLREPTDFYDLVLALGVERVEDIDFGSKPTAERQALLQQLLIGERDQVFLGVLRATFGDERTLGFTCTACGSKQDLILSLTDDFKPKVVEDLHTNTYTMTTGKGDVIEYRLANGGDQQEALSRKGATQVEQNSIIMSRCIVKVNNQDGFTIDPMGYVRRMSMRDRQVLLAALIEKQPSVDLEVTSDCSSCGAPQTLPLGWADLFRAR